MADWGLSSLEREAGAWGDGPHVAEHAPPPPSTRCVHTPMIMGTGQVLPTCHRFTTWSASSVEPDKARAGGRACLGEERRRGKGRRVEEGAFDFVVH
jgi:hypothetical protein